MGTLTFGSFGLSGSDPDICIDLLSGMFDIPSLRGADWIVPRLDGRIEGNRRKDLLILTAQGFVRGSGATPDDRREDFYSNVTALVAAIDPSLGIQTLTAADGYLGLPTGSEATISARVRSSSPGKVQNGQSYQLWSLEFECITPDWDIGS